MDSYFSMFSFIIRLFTKIFPFTPVYAHCDIPCGIYTSEPAVTAASTVVKMVEKILALPLDGSLAEMLQARNSFVRMVHVKEEHAQICKKELLILWTDYFKPEHLQMFPDLHERVWKAVKLCSKAKQEVNMEIAQELKKAVDEIAGIFVRAQAVKKK